MFFLYLPGIMEEKPEKDDSMNPNTLYYQDAHSRRFSAKVLCCAPCSGGWQVVLDNTAFYPEGGGQAADTGTLGSVNVMDVREKGETILHFCDAPLEEGAMVEGVINWERRFDLMQQHSGEHILSGLIHSRYGYHNVGFHMGADTVTIDFDGMIPVEDLPLLEKLANEAIWKDLEITSRFYEEQELVGLPYRSKKPLTGTVRLVEVPGYDLCACCGTHVKRTGEIGQIKILSWVKFHQGIRMEIVCGGRALSYFSRLQEQNRQVSNVFSAAPLETGAAARKFRDELEAARFRVVGLENQLFDYIAEGCRGKGDVVLFQPELSPDALRRLTDKVGSLCGGRCVVLSGSEEAGYRYAICHVGQDLREFVKQWNLALSGRGGGKGGFAQGSCNAGKAQIEAFLNL